MLFGELPLEIVEKEGIFESEILVSVYNTHVDSLKIIVLLNTFIKIKRVFMVNIMLHIYTFSFSIIISAEKRVCKDATY